MPLKMVVREVEDSGCCSGLRDVERSQGKWARYVEDFGVQRGSGQFIGNEKAARGGMAEDFPMWQLPKTVRRTVISRGGLAVVNNT